MGSRQLEVGDYVRWDKSDPKSCDYAVTHGDGVMQVIRCFYDTGLGEYLVNLVFVTPERKPVGKNHYEGSPAVFFPHRFVKDVFLTAASKAIRKETNGSKNQQADLD